MTTDLKKIIIFMSVLILSLVAISLGLSISAFSTYSNIKDGNLSLLNSKISSSQITINKPKSWIPIPLAATRGSFLILASGTKNNDSSIAALMTLSSGQDVKMDGNVPPMPGMHMPSDGINILSMSYDYSTNWRLQVGWVEHNQKISIAYEKDPSITPTTSNIPQFPKFVNILVIRA